MKRVICLLIAAAVMISLPVLSQANDVTGTAFKMMFLAEMQYYGHGAQWTENQSGGEITETAYLNGNQYRMYVRYRGAYDSGTGVEKAYELGITGPFYELEPGYDPYSEGSGYIFRPGLDFYLAFFTAVYDLGIMPDNDNCGTFSEAGLLSPYEIYNHLTDDSYLYYDQNTWKTVIHRKGYLEAVNYNGVRVIVSGTPGGTYEAYVSLP